MVFQAPRSPGLCAQAASSLPWENILEGHGQPSAHACVSREEPRSCWEAPLPVMLHQRWFWHLGIGDSAGNRAEPILTTELRMEQWPAPSCRSQPHWCGVHPSSFWSACNKAKRAAPDPKCGVQGPGNKEHESTGGAVFGETHGLEEWCQWWAPAHLKQPCSYLQEVSQKAQSREQGRQRSLKLEKKSKRGKKKTQTKQTYRVGNEVTEVASVESDHHLFPEAPLIILDAISLKQILFNFIVPDQAVQFLRAGHFLAFIRLSQ